MSGEQTEDWTENDNIIKIFKPKIIESLSADVMSVSDKLFEMGVLIENDSPEIGVEYNNRGGIAASVMLIERMQKRSSDWFNLFIEVARTCKLDNIADMLKVPEYHMTGCCAGKLSKLFLHVLYIIKIIRRYWHGCCTVFFSIYFTYKIRRAKTSHVRSRLL